MADRRSLTRRQKEVLQFVSDYLEANGLSPTLKEIAEHLEVSKITVHEHVNALVEKGYLRKEANISRSLVPSESEDVEPAGLTLPIFGNIAAGYPIEAVADREELDLSGWLGGDQNYFVLRVKGYSMIEDHIQDGDYVVVDPHREPRNGDPVVALIEGQEATLKRFYREPNRIRLQPANSELDPIFARDVEVQGVVVGVLRRM